MNKSPWHEANKERLREYQREYAKKYRAANREKTRLANREWYLRNRSTVLANAPRYYQNKRSGILFKKYGITLDQYNGLLASQNGRCAICKTDTPGGRGCFHVDHCHATGRVRGILCNPCNRMIGMAKDKPEILTAAARYLTPII